MEATLQEILDAREQRVLRQRELLSQYQKPLICFTMNIPGPVKLDRDVSIGFFVGCRLLRDSLAGHLVYAEEHRRNTGCEAFYVADLPARELKQLTLELEDADAVGRLFDMDVLDTDGKKLSREDMGAPRRSCLLCDTDAMECASRRAHSLEELTDRTSFLLYLAARQHMAEYIAVRAYLALTQEVSATPKPGLVDRNNSGSHKDMTIRHFFASANALRPYFCRFAETGYLTRDLSPSETFQKIRPLGKEAEAAMLKATRGVNTHKGAIFSLGILCAAAGRLSPEHWQAENLLAEAAAMTKGLVAVDLGNVTRETAVTHGEKLFTLHGITGIRGQAEAGFPAVAQVGLPALRQALEQGLSFNDALCTTLLYLFPVTEDTNFIHRSDLPTLKNTQAEMQTLLADDPFPAMERIQKLDEEFIAHAYSPGGTADLLAVTCFLYLLGG